MPTTGGDITHFIQRQDMHDTIVILEQGLHEVADNISQLDEMEPNPFIDVAQETAGEPKLCVNPLGSFVGEW